MFLNRFYRQLGERELFPIVEETAETAIENEDTACEK